MKCSVLDLFSWIFWTNSCRLIYNSVGYCTPMFERDKIKILEMIRNQLEIVFKNDRKTVQIFSGKEVVLWLDSPLTTYWFCDKGDLDFMNLTETWFYHLTGEFKSSHRDRWRDCKKWDTTPFSFLFQDLYLVRTRKEYLWWQLSNTEPYNML